MLNKSLATIAFLSLSLPISIVASEVSAINTEAVKQDITQVHKAQSNEELAKELANPIANLISLPLQLNYDRGFLDISGNDSNKWTLNVQPVIPFSISDDWNVISRTIVPLIRTDNYPLNSGTKYGVGDVVQSLFFSPKVPTDSGWIWGVGPVFLVPSGSDLSADTWGAGLTAVALKQDGPLTYGGLINHVWSMDGNIDISTTFIQPFFTYTTPEAISFTAQTETTYNWEASKGNEWSIPLNFIIAKVCKIGSQTVSYGAGVRYYAQSPNSGADGLGMRLTFTMLFPK